MYDFATSILELTNQEDVCIQDKSYDDTDISYNTYQGNDDTKYDSYNDDADSDRNNDPNNDNDYTNDNSDDIDNKSDNN